MAFVINDGCVSCGACEAQCPEHYRKIDEMIRERHRPKDRLGRGKKKYPVNAARNSVCFRMRNTVVTVTMKLLFSIIGTCILGSFILK